VFHAPKGRKHANDGLRVILGVKGSGLLALSCQIRSDTFDEAVIDSSLFLAGCHIVSERMLAVLRQYTSCLERENNAYLGDTEVSVSSTKSVASDCESSLSRGVCAPAARRVLPVLV
jgi:hypothetical protein